MSVYTLVQRRVLTVVACRARAARGFTTLAHNNSSSNSSSSNSATCSTSSTSVTPPPPTAALAHRPHLLSFISPLISRQLLRTATPVRTTAQQAASSNTASPQDAASTALPRSRDLSPEERARREAEAREASERSPYDDGSSDQVRRRQFRLALVGAGATLLLALPLMDYFTNQELKACGPYKSAMRIIARSPLVEEHLGHPIREGYRVSSKRNANKLRLEWSIISGDKSATIVSTSVFVNRQGSFTELYMLLDSGERIDLLNTETPH